MEIKLKNVKTHRTLNMTTPNSGLIRIAGQSGKGKSTILDAIFEALYGDADDIYTWGESSAQIDLDILGINIKRTKGPKTLEVTKDGTVYKDEAAQGVINETVGMTSHEFLASSYIQQNLSGSLLMLGQADQLRFIQALGVGVFDVDALKKKISNTIKSLETELAVKTVVLSNATESKNELEQELEQELVKIDELLRESSCHPGTEAEGLVLSSKKAELVEEIVKKTKLIHELRADYRLFANSEQTLNALKQKKATIDEEIETKRKEHGDMAWTQGYPWSDKSQKDIDKQKALLADAIRRKQILREIKVWGEEAQTICGDNTTKPSILIDAAVAANKKETDQLLQNINVNLSKISELIRLQDNQHCPNCAIPLAVINGTVNLSTAKPENIEDLCADLKNENKKHKIAIGQLESATNQLVTIKIKVSDLISRLPSQNEYGQLEIDELLKVSEELDSYYNSQVELEKALYSHEEAIKKILNDIEVLIKKSTAVKEEIVKATPKTDFTLTESDIDKEEQSLESIRIKLSDTQQALEAWNIAEIKYKQHVKNMRNYRQQCTKLNTITETSVAHQTAIDVITKKINANKRLRSLVDSASVSAIESVIDNINALANDYITLMFPETGTTVKLKNTTTTKTGDEKPRLSLEIFHKGLTAKRLQSLSGGERSRVVLAFQLAMSKMYNSKILMVDEGFTGLGDEDKASCVEMLRNFSSEKLVIAIEHGAQNYHFDEVISL